MKMNVYMENNLHETLFAMATEFLKLSDNEKLSLGLKLGVINLNAVMLPSSQLSERVFANAYRMNKLYDLIKEIGKLRPQNEPGA
jgi:uncharacterized protein (DUF4213/DUF364 family)